MRRLDAHDNPEPIVPEWLAGQRGFAFPLDVVGLGWVYLLCTKRGGVLYIGQTKRLIARIFQHADRFSWDHARVVQVSGGDDMRREVESALIWYFRPPYNRTSNGGDGYSAINIPPRHYARCRELGLPDRNDPWYVAARDCWAGVRTSWIQREIEPIGLLGSAHP